MSEAQKPVEETPVVAPATETPAAEPTATETPAAEAPKETPAENAEAAPAAATETTETPAEQPKEEAKKEVTPATEGVLGHKAPGLVKSLRFSKRFFYFSDDAVEAKNLSVFQQNEKPAVANPTVAWATQTGKGLLFLTKRAEDKATPAGIFNLADVSDITKDGSNEVYFKVNGQKHTFQAANAGERDSWVAAFEAKAAEAKAEKETLVASEGYKAQLEKLTKPAAPAAAAAAETKKAEPKEEAKDEAAPAEEKKEEKKASRSKSGNRSNRGSIFGSLLGKKEEAKENKEEKKEEAKPEEAQPVEPTTETTAEATPAAEASTEAAAPAPATDDKEKAKEDNQDKKEEKKDETEKPKTSKRGSILGFFKVSSPSQEKTEKEATGSAETPVASTAPQLENPVDEAAVKPIEPESVTAPTEGEASKDATPAKEETPAAKDGQKEKRRSFFFGGKNALSRMTSKANKNKETPAPEASEDKAENKPEPISKDTPAEEAKPEETKPAEAPAAAEENKPADVATPTPVQAAA